MGGNGSYSHFIAKTLGTYLTDRYQQVDKIGKTKVIVVTTQKNEKQPMNSFTSYMYYVTATNHPERITSITFYDKKTHGIKKSIDLKYDDTGSLLGYGTFVKRGKTHTTGTHAHRWFLQCNGDYGRKSHDGNNCFKPTKTDMIYIRRALRYNVRKVKEK